MSGVDFIKVGSKAQIIEIALSKLGMRHKAHPMPLKSFSKVGRRAQIGRKKFMKSTPGRVMIRSLPCKKILHEVNAKSRYREYPCLSVFILKSIIFTYFNSNRGHWYAQVQMGGVHQNMFERGYLGS